MKIQYLCLVVFLSLIKNTLGNASKYILKYIKYINNNINKYFF